MKYDLIGQNKDISMKFKFKRFFFYQVHIFFKLIHIKIISSNYFGKYYIKKRSVSLHVLFAVFKL